MAQAAKTWNGEWWKLGGGGTVWDSMAYDPELDLLYIGTGNGSPWNQALRSPGGGDNLFLVVDRRARARHRRVRLALPDDARRELGLHRDAADHRSPTSTIDGAPRKVLMQAPKNGFFYVLDRATGELISAEQVRCR